MSSNNVYLDNAAATPIDNRVKKEIIRGMGFIGNPSSYNDAGRMAREELEKARLFIARFLGAKPQEIIFTSSGSESNNLAIFGLADKKDLGGTNEIITTPIEHLSVLEPLEKISSRGFKTIFIKVGRLGLVDLDDLASKINSKTLLVSVMYANNEIGAIEPIKNISKIIKNFRRIDKSGKPFFHVDACQATEYLDMNVNNLGIDLLTLNGSKIYGPRGIGVLYVKRGIRLRGLILGGEQEFGLRAGTENLPAIVGLAKAISLINKKEAKGVVALRDYFLENIKRVIPEVKINGPSSVDRLPNNINISIPGFESERVLLELDKYGIYASSGSACTSHSVEPSHVLKAIGVERKYLSGALRFSLGRQTTKKDIDYLLWILPKIVTNLKKRYS